MPRGRKVCPGCQALVGPRTRVCPECNFEFAPKGEAPSTEPGPQVDKVTVDEEDSGHAFETAKGTKVFNVVKCHLRPVPAEQIEKQFHVSRQHRMEEGEQTILLHPILIGWELQDYGLGEKGINYSWAKVVLDMSTKSVAVWEKTAKGSPDMILEGVIE